MPVGGGSGGPPYSVFRLLLISPSFSTEPYPHPQLCQIPRSRPFLVYPSRKQRSCLLPFEGGTLDPNCSSGRPKTHLQKYILYLNSWAPLGFCGSNQPVFLSSPFPANTLRRAFSALSSLLSCYSSILSSAFNIWLMFLFSVISHCPCTFMPLHGLGGGELK